MQNRINTSSLTALTKPKRRNHIRTGNIVEKIAATVQFNSELANKIYLDDRSRVQLAGLKMLATYFEAYVDNLSRSNHAKYHHIYEPNQTGDSTARLFVSTLDKGKTPKLMYSFKQSSSPSDSGYVFRNRAFVMENGIPLNIKPKNEEYLKFEYNGKFYQKKQVYVSQPGGPEVQGSFSELFNKFMTTAASKALVDLEFFSRIENGMKKESAVVLKKISSGRISGMASEAASASDRIVRKLK
jgi:hypothetical protein